MKTIVAKVLWWDRRDGYGIAVDDSGNEFYMSIDSCKGRSAPLESQLIRGELNEAIIHTPCLKNVRDFLDTSAE